MILNTFKRNRFLKFMAAAVACLFLINDLAWAYPDIGHAPISATLTPPNFMQSMTDTRRIGIAVVGFLAGIESKIEDIHVNPYPEVKGKRVKIFFDHKTIWKIKDNEYWVIPCKVNGIEYEALVGVKDRSLASVVLKGHREDPVKTVSEQPEGHDQDGRDKVYNAFKGVLFADAKPSVNKKSAIEAERTLDDIIALYGWQSLVEAMDDRSGFTASELNILAEHLRKIYSPQYLNGDPSHIELLKKHAEDVSDATEKWARTYFAGNPEMERMVALFRVVSLAHDIGKAISAEKLAIHYSHKKKEAMTRQELDLIHEHSHDAFTILSKHGIRLPPEAVLLIAVNHEPELQNTLKGFSDKFSEKILALSMSDRFCAMSEHRPYMENDDDSQKPSSGTPGVPGTGDTFRKESGENRKTGTSGESFFKNISDGLMSLLDWIDGILDRISNIRFRDPIVLAELAGTGAKVFAGFRFPLILAMSGEHAPQGHPSTGRSKRIQFEENPASAGKPSTDSKRPHSIDATIHFGLSDDWLSADEGSRPTILTGTYEVSNCLKPQFVAVTAINDMEKMLELMKQSAKGGDRNWILRSCAQHSRKYESGAPYAMFSPIDEMNLRQRINLMIGTDAGGQLPFLQNILDYYRKILKTDMLRIYVGSKTGYFQVKDLNSKYPHELDLVIMVNGDRELETIELTDDFVKSVQGQFGEDVINKVTLKIVGMETLRKATQKELVLNEERRTERLRMQEFMVELYRKYIPAAGSWFMEESEQFAASFSTMEQSYLAGKIAAMESRMSACSKLEKELEELKQEDVITQLQARRDEIKTELGTCLSSISRIQQLIGPPDQQKMALASLETEKKRFDTAKSTYRSMSVVARMGHDKTFASFMLRYDKFKQNMKAYADLIKQVKDLRAELDACEAEVQAHPGEHIRIGGEISVLQRDIELLAKEVEDMQIGRQRPGSALMPGSFIHNKYKIIGVIGRGGFGVVYRAKDVDEEARGRESEVAIKMATVFPNDAETIASFRREIYYLNERFEGAPIPAFKAVGSYGDNLYFVMSLKRCKTLAEIIQDLKTGRLRLNMWERMVLAYAAARLVLEFQEKTQLIHRDIKPANLMIPVGPDGNILIPPLPDGIERGTRQARKAMAIYLDTRAVKRLWLSASVIDLGIAKQGEGAIDEVTGAETILQSSKPTDQTLGGLIKGTLKYMAPEQTDTSQGGTVSGKADIYALGASIYELLTGGNFPIGDGVRTGDDESNAKIVYLKRESDSMVPDVVMHDRVVTREDYARLMVIGRSVSRRFVEAGIIVGDNGSLIEWQDTWESGLPSDVKWKWAPAVVFNRAKLIKNLKRMEASEDSKMKKIEKEINSIKKSIAKLEKKALKYETKRKPGVAEMRKDLSEMAERIKALSSELSSQKLIRPKLSDAQRAEIAVIIVRPRIPRDMVNLLMQMLINEDRMPKGKTSDTYRRPEAKEVVAEFELILRGAPSRYTYYNITVSTLFLLALGFSLNSYIMMNRAIEGRKNAEMAMGISEKDLEDAKAEAEKEGITDVSGNAVDVRVRIFEKRKTDAMSRLDSIAKEIKAASDELSDKKSATEAMQARIEALKKQMADLEKQAAALSSLVAGKLKDRVGLELSLAVLRKEMDAAKAELELARGKLKTVNEEIEKKKLESEKEAPKKEGFIRQGEESLKEFRSRRANGSLRYVEGKYRERVLEVLDNVLSGTEVSLVDNLVLKLRREEVEANIYKISAFDSIIKSDDDFFLGANDMMEGELFIAEDLLDRLEETGDGALVDEYLLHEFLCPIMGHYQAIRLQQDIFPDNYPDKEALKSQTMDKLYKGLLGKNLRSFIDGRRAPNMAETMARFIKEGTLSLAFSGKVVLAFDKNIAQRQDQAPLGRLVEVLNELKDDPRYRKILKNLVIITAPAEELSNKLKVYAEDKNAKVFVFADASDDTREKLGQIPSGVNSVYIDEKDFQPRAYYPIAEIVVIALSQYCDRLIKEGDIATALNIDGRSFDLAALNIGSLKVDNGVLIVKLLPASEQHDMQMLIKRYAAIREFLEAA
jgi:serine/threonine protein kinase